MTERFTRADMPRIMALIAGFFDSCNPEQEYVLELKEYRRKRSLDANAYYWTLVGQIAAAAQVDVTTVYREHIREIGGNFDILCVKAGAAEAFCKVWESRGIGWIAEKMPSKLPGCINVRAFYGSSTYDTRQMTRLIDLAVQDCKEWGIDSRTPAEIAAMLDKWEEANAG